jgi:hypothetical protein
MFKELKNTKIIFVLVLLFYCSPVLNSQIDPTIQKYRDEPLGDPGNRKGDTLDANYVNTLFYNTGLFGNWPNGPSFEWPIGTDQRYSDGMTMVVEGKIFATANGRVYHPLETYYYEGMDKSPVNGKIWGFEPVPGYTNLTSSKPAMSNDPASWPSVWPTALNLPDDYNGHWYGFFGRDIFNADLETFFVLDDSQDKEWLPFGFYPILNDSSRGGLGLRVEVRELQWSNYGLEDIIFLHYDIINISDYDYDSVFVGFYNNLGVGGSDAADDMASFDKKIDLAYGFDSDGFGDPGNGPTGFIGIALLESPGNPFDGIDNDEDGMIDEMRNDGIDNDGDWNPEFDDVGADGTPGTGDFGEGDGIPTSGEPNFDQTDKDESDQIGLTSFATILHTLNSTYGFPKDDESYWEIFTSGIDTSIQNANLSIITGSGPYNLRKGMRERISAAIILGSNREDLFYNKDIAQIFYNSNYGFASIINPNTQLTTVAAAGSQILEVVSNEGFSVGDEIVINLGGENEEINIITGFGSILLQNPLQYYHEAGEPLGKLITTSVRENYETYSSHYNLDQNYPNPFNPITTISYSLPATALVKIKIFNILGQEIATLVNQEKPAGNYEVNFNASNLPSGVYIYKMKAGEYVETRKMVLLK